MPPGLTLTSVSLRLVLVSASGNFPLTFYGPNADGLATMADGERTDVLLAAGILVPGNVELADHPDVEILDKLALWPDLPATGTPAASAVPHFEIQVATTRPCRWRIPLRLELTADGGYGRTEYFVLEMVDPPVTDLAASHGRPVTVSANAGDELGGAVATGDLDGDGYDDLVVGAPGGDGPGNTRSNAGEVIILYGGPSRGIDADLAAPPPGVASIFGDDDSDFLGLSLATGDLDGDSFDDLVLGVQAGDGPANARPNGGEVVVIYGGPSRLTAVDLAAPPAGVAFVHGAELADHLGVAVATGDLNLDGYDDLVLGADGGDGPGNTRSNAGEAAVVYGGPSRLTSVDLAAPPAGVAFVFGADTADQLGGSVATGDLDGDFPADLVLGAAGGNGPDNGRFDAGEAVVVYGTGLPLANIDLASSPAGVAVLFGADVSDQLGSRVATGDLDSDGYADLILGAAAGDGPDDARTSASEVTVIYGAPTRLSSVDLAAPPPQAALLYGADGGDDLGGSMATGDLDGDGFDELILGAPGGMGPANSRVGGTGEVVVIAGSPSRLTSMDLSSPPPDVALVFGDFGDALGRAVAAGDLDGDGFDNLIVGAPSGDGFSGVRYSAGEIAVIPGGPHSRYRHDPAPFAPIDATVGTDLGLNCDNCGTTIPIGFEFDFFGRKVTEVTVGSNGYLTFSGFVGGLLPLGCMPGSGPPGGIIAPFWVDLDPSLGGAVYALLEGTAPNRRLTSEWMGVPLAGGAGDGTFEMTLFETSDRIVMQYLDVVFGTGSDNGATAVVGVDNATGANGTPFSCFSPSVANGSAIGWRRFASPTAIFSDDAESGPAGFTATGLWHREQESASACSPASRSGDWSWYYGQSSSCDYETPGLANSRTLTTQLIEGLPQDARLSFWQRRQTEGLAAYDISRVDVQADGGGFAPVMPFADESNAWRHTEDFVPPFPELGRFSSLDLSDHTGRDVELRFSFATVDSQFNTFLGWMVDDVAIHACPVFAPGGRRRRRPRRGRRRIRR